MNATETHALVEIAKELGVNCHQQHVPLSFLTEMLRPYRLAIILLDWSVILGNEEEYSGHFVPIVGYNETHIFVHNQMPESIGKCFTN